MKKEVSKYLEHAKDATAAIEKDWENIDYEYDRFLSKFIDLCEIAKDINKLTKIDFSDYNLVNPERCKDYNINTISDEEADAVYNAWELANDTFNNFEYDVDICFELIVKLNKIIETVRKMGTSMDYIGK